MKIIISNSNLLLNACSFIILIVSNFCWNNMSVSMSQIFEKGRNITQDYTDLTYLAFVLKMIKIAQTDDLH